MTARLTLPFPPSTNNLFATIVRNGHVVRIPSARYKQWRKAAADALRLQSPLPRFEGPVVMTLTFGRPDKRSRDVSNLIKGVEDLAVSLGIIVDDSLVERVTAQWGDVVGCVVEIDAADINTGTLCPPPIAGRHQ